MKHVEIKRVWVDDENHHLKGYPVNQLTEVPDSWIASIWNSIKCWIKSWSK